MALTENTYTGNGSTTSYTFSFPYLEETDVKVSLDGTIVTTYTFANSSTIQFASAPANGVAIRIYRDTAIEQAKATFFTGSAIRAEDLNTNFKQSLYTVQENNNETAEALADSATALTTANTALSTANTASTNASTAVTTANTALSTANAASTAASTATTTANNASTIATNAVNTANTASTNASNAVNTANQAASDIAALEAAVYTAAELDAGQLDNRYYTETELNSGQLANRY